jgi:proline iminopeptidase
LCGPLVVPAADRPGYRRGVPSPYPPIEPDAAGTLDVGDGQLLRWECCGRRDGRAAVVLHGGPGSGCTPALRRLFDPAVHRVVLFDQRGAGRSTPHAGDPATSLAANTTHHLVEDIERLRRHLDVDRWLVYGVSWGSTLGLAYAERHPEHVSELILAPVTLTRRSDVEWLTRGAARFFPAEWERFAAGVPPEERDGDLSAAYSRLLEHPDPGARDRAARDWCDWEEALVAHETGSARNPRYDDPRFRLGFARTVTHYFRHAAFLAEDALLRDAHRLQGIPGVLVAGRLDLAGPPASAWELARAWPDAELVVVEGAGHTSDAVAAHVVAGTDRFGRRDQRQ